MSLLRYLKRKDGLPDPKASLTSKVPTQAIVRANREVEAELEQKKYRLQLFQNSFRDHSHTHH